jgi:putative membrane protein
MVDWSLRNGRCHRALAIWEKNLTRTVIPALFSASAHVLGLAPCGEKTLAAELTPIARIAAPEAPATAMPEPGVATFVEKAAISDMFEIKSARMAIERSKVKPIKDVTKTMVDVHMASSVELALLVSPR